MRVFCVDSNFDGCYNHDLFRSFFDITCPVPDDAKGLINENTGCLKKRGFFEMIAGNLIFEKGDMMKSVSASVCKVILAVVLCSLAFLSIGCSAEQMGETTAQGEKRHQRNLRINQQELNADIDKVLLLDKPSGLTDKRIH